MEVEKQVPARKDNAGSSAIIDANATKPVTAKRDAPGSARVSVPRPEPQIPRVPASEPIETAREVPLPASPMAPGNPEKKTIAGPSAMPMARVRSLLDMLNLPADTGRPVEKADPPAKRPEASKRTSKKPSNQMDTSKN